MSYYIKMNNDLEINLPNEYTLKERIKLCEKIINDYPQFFEMSMKSTSYRLETMASYILDAADKNQEYTILTPYKERRNKIKEITFSEIEQKYDNNEKKY